MQQVGEDRFAKRIVAQILDHAAAVRVGVRLLQLDRGQPGKAVQQQRLDRIVPGEIDDLLVRQNRVGGGRTGERHQHDRKEGQEPGEEARKAHRIVVPDHPVRRYAPSFRAAAT